MNNQVNTCIYWITLVPFITLWYLKLVRTPLNIYFTAFESIFLSLYEPITSDECHAWFHLNAVSPATFQERGTSEHYKKFLSMVGFEPPTPHLLFSSVSL